MRELTKQCQWTHILEKFFIYYIVGQPILDVTAFFEWPVSQYIRILALCLGILYLFMHRQTGLVPKARWYVIALLGYMAVHMLVTMIVKTPVNVADEVSYMIKTVYFPVMLITYATVFKSMAKQNHWDKRIWSFVVLNMGVISTVMLLSTLTDTGRRTYGALAKAGHSGWFFSGNELSAIFAMGFSVILMYVLLEASGWIRYVTVALAGLTAWAMLILGTKVAFGSVLLSLAAALIFVLIDQYQIKQRLRNMTVIITLIVAVLVMTPLTPIGNNLDFFLGEEQQAPEEVSDSDSANPPLLSGRKDFLTDKTQQYLNASTIQKVSGLGYAGFYDTTPILTEMDLFDWGFAYGPLGLILLLLPLLYGGGIMIRQQWQTRFRYFSMKMAFITVAGLLGLTTGIVAGHVWSSPSASIYLSIVLAALFTLNRQPLTRFDEKRMYDATKVGNNISDQHHVSEP